MRVITTSKTTASLQLSALPGRVCGLWVITDGAADTTVYIFDNACASSGGAPVRQITVDGANWYGGFSLTNDGFAITNGIYCALSSTGTSTGDIAYWVDYWVDKSNQP